MNFGCCPHESDFLRAGLVFIVSEHSSPAQRHTWSALFGLRLAQRTRYDPHWRGLNNLPTKI